MRAPLSVTLAAFSAIVAQTPGHARMALSVEDFVFDESGIPISRSGLRHAGTSGGANSLTGRLP